MAYKVRTVTRIQEGASMEDIENGDAYETAYIVTDENGDIIWDTTNYENVKKYVEENITKERLETITKELINYLAEVINDDEELWNVLENSIGMSSNEIDQLCGNFDYDREGFDDEYIPSSNNGDYSPSNPWDAPGMSISDFI